MLCIGHCISDDILEENLENTTSLLIDEATYSLDPTSASKTTDSRLGDSLDVIAKDLAMTLSPSLSETFASLPSARHG